MLPCTNLKQSRQLLELGINPSTADWRLQVHKIGENIEIVPKFSFTNEFYMARPGEFPSWSINSLLALLSELTTSHFEFFMIISDGNYHVGYKFVGETEPIIEKVREDVYEALIELIEFLTSIGKLV